MYRTGPVSTQGGRCSIVDQGEMLTAGMVERRHNNNAAMVAALIESKGNSRICRKSCGLSLAPGSQRAVPMLAGLKSLAAPARSPWGRSAPRITRGSFPALPH
jgi:hypothetical protein